MTINRLFTLATASLLTLFASGSAFAIEDPVTNVPDGGSMALLLGMALAGMAAFKRLARKS